MDFGYFTLSDNNFPDNPRSPEQFMMEIRDQSILADRLGMNSVWIGEHHFNRRGCVSMPGMILSNIASVTEHVRLAPAVTVLPVHNPIMVAEEWATLDRLSGGRVDFAMGRGYDAVEYAPFNADFQQSAEIFAEGVELLSKCWTSDGPFSFKGKYYNCEDIEVFPRPLQKPFIPYIGCFSSYSMEIAAKYDWNIIFAPFAANLVFGSLGKAVEAYREACAKVGNAPRRASCSYFIHIGGSDEEQRIGRHHLLTYLTNSGMRAKKQAKPAKMPPTMQYFAKIHAHLENLEAKDLDEASMLVGSPQNIIDTLKRVEADGISEVILYFNHGMKPDAMVRDQMEWFMRDIAPAFEGNHIARLATAS